MQPVDEPALDERLVRDRFAALTARLRAAAEAAGRDPDGFRIVAVTKGFGVEVVEVAAAAGLPRLGENRVQEALRKMEVHPELEWHLIGHLQSNKARPAAEAFAWIHSVHGIPLLERLEALGHDAARAPRLLLQVNLSDEASKSGWHAEAFAQAIRPGGELVRALGRMRAVRVEGLMTIARFGASPSEARDTFARLRHLRDRLREASGLALPELSMGMTADAEAGVSEGATLVRVGTALFGPRPA